MAIINWSILPSAGLYKGCTITVVEIIYKDRVVGPNNKEHYHFPDYVVVSFPHVALPPHIRLSERKHPSVSQFHILRCTLT